MKIVQVLALCLLVMQFGCNTSTKSESVNVEQVKQVTKKLKGKYGNIGSGWYSAVEFRGSSTCIIHGLGMEYATDYTTDEELVRVNTDKGVLLFTQKNDSTLVGEGYAEGIYVLGHVRTKKRKAKRSVQSEDEKKKLEIERQRRIEEVKEARRKVSGAFGEATVSKKNTN